MLLIFKQKPLILDCFTYVPHAYDFAKIDYAHKFIPQWWKNTPSFTGKDHATIKHCQGFIDYYKRGIILPAWFEMELNILEQGHPNVYTWVASNADVSTGNSHYSEQFSGFAKQDAINIKLESPWAIKTKEEVYFSWSEPTWNIRDLLFKLIVLPGVINFKYQHATNINLLAITNSVVKELYIPPRTPLGILHPLTERNIEIKTHLVTKEDWLRVHGLNKLFFARNANDSIKLYKSKKRIIDEISCPYTGKTK